MDREGARRDSPSQSMSAFLEVLTAVNKRVYLQQLGKAGPVGRVVYKQNFEVSLFQMAREKRGGKIVGGPPCTPQLRATLLQPDWSRVAWRGTQTCRAARSTAVHCDLSYELQGGWKYGFFLRKTSDVSLVWRSQIHG